MSGGGILTGRIRALTAWVLLVAVSAIGWAHAPATCYATSPEEQARYQAFVLAWGDAADLCADEDEGEGEHGRHQDCPDCRIVLALPLPDRQAPIVDAPWTLLTRIAALRESRVVARVRDPAHGLRAPPLV